MSYAVKIGEKLLGDISKLSRDVRLQIVEKVKGLRVDPVRNTQPVKGKPRFRKLRVGDYRVIIQISHKPKEVIVVYAGHRSTIYEELERFF